MRSVSIVYHNQTREETTALLPKNNSLVKRSVDQYYSKLVDKEKNREKMRIDPNQSYQRNKVKTSNSSRNSLDYNIIGLNIAQISLRHLPEEKRYEDKNKEKAMIMRKLDTGKMVLKGLNLPHAFDSYDDEDNLQKYTHCKLKNLHKNKVNGEVKDTIIVISANFVIDEHCFWQQEGIEQLSVRFWKILQSHAVIVWLCEKEQTYKKLMRYSKQNNLRLDGVYLILGKKSRRSLTVSYHSIQNDYGVRFHKSSSPLVMKDEKKLVAIHGLAVEQGRELEFDNFYLSIPIIKNYRSVVHYIRIDMNDKVRLNTILKVLSQQSPPKPLDLITIIQRHQRQSTKSKIEQTCQCKYKYINGTTNILQKMQQIKTKMTRYFNQSLSLNLNDRVVYDQSQNSIQFIIGDILRRNYRIFQNYYQYNDQYGEYKEHQKVHSTLVQNQAKGTTTKKYRNKAYIWDL